MTQRAKHAESIHDRYSTVLSLASSHPPILTVLWFFEILRVTTHHTRFLCSEFKGRSTVNGDIKLFSHSKSEPHTSVTALQDACVRMSVCLSMYVWPYSKKFQIERTEMEVPVHFKFAHVLKFCAINVTEDSSLCNSTLMNLLSGRDKFRLEQKERATARLQC